MNEQIGDWSRKELRPLEQIFLGATWLDKEVSGKRE